MRDWISFASALKNESYIEKLLIRYKINDYKFSVNGYGDYDLYIIYGLDTFKVSIDEKINNLIIHKKITYRKAQKRKKEYFVKVYEVGGLDCWLNAIKYITQG